MTRKCKLTTSRLSLAVSSTLFTLASTQTPSGAPNGTITSAPVDSPLHLNFSLTALFNASLDDDILRQASQVLARQVPPSETTSSSYDYWWPYPAAGATTATSTTALPITTTDTAATPTDTPWATLALPSLSLSSYQSAAFISSASLTYTTSSSSPSSSSSSNITTITALPPSSTPTTHARAPIHLNPIYLIPVFAVVGLVTGSLFAWAAAKCCCGKRKPHSNDLVSGPRYIAAQGDEMLAREQEEKAWLAMQMDMQRQQTQTSEAGARTPFSWPSVTPRPYSAATTPQGYQYEKGETFDREEEIDMQQPVRAVDHDHDHEELQPPTPLTLQPQLATTPYPLSLLSPKDDTEDEPQTVHQYDSVRQKSVRRSLLSRIIGSNSVRRSSSSRSVRRSASGRATVKSVKSGRAHVPSTPELEEGWALVRSPVSPEYGEVESPLSLKRARTDLVKARTRKSTRSLRRADSERSPTQMIALSRADTGIGFRIVQEDPEEGWEDVPLVASPTSRQAEKEKDEEESTGSWMRNVALEISKSLALATPSRTRVTSRASDDGEEDGDRYSPIPLRTKREGMSPMSSRAATQVSASSPSTPHRTPTRSAKERATPHRTPTRSRTARRTPAKTPTRADTILPPTPAILTSPHFDSQLFFGSPVQSPSRTFTSPHQNTDHRAATTTRKLHTTRKAPPLPYPSPARLTKTPTKVLKPTGHSPPALRPSSSSRPTSSGARESYHPASPKERYKARHGALNKVDEILSHSWSERELSGGSGVGLSQSPTMFGAIHSVQGEEGQMGIEQRLLG